MQPAPGAVLAPSLITPGECPPEILQASLLTPAAGEPNIFRQPVLLTEIMIHLKTQR